ncbi:MAG TPA: hypothetical protein VFZ83_01510 [Acidimicrobiia bacterium]|nr:hypothetical protein [Acidimicrobiia bacterium]
MTSGGSGAPIARHEPGMGDLEIFPLPVDEASLLNLLRIVFERHWSTIRFGTLVQGAVFEIRAPAPPRIAMLDGYATIDLGDSHVHVCIGDHRGTPDAPVTAALAQHRRCHRAELYRVLHDGVAAAWGVRLYNGADEQQLTVILPHPFLDDDQHVLDAPEWDRLACWDELRATFLGLDPDPRDRALTAFLHV